MLRCLRDAGSLLTTELAWHAVALACVVKKQTSSDCILRKRNNDDDGAETLLASACLMSCCPDTEDKEATWYRILDSFGTSSA